MSLRTKILLFAFVIGIVCGFLITLGSAQAKSCKIHCPENCDECEICEECPVCPDCICECSDECPDLKCPSPCGDPCPDVTVSCPACPSCDPQLVCDPELVCEGTLEPGMYTGYLVGANTFSRALLWGMQRVDLEETGVSAAAVVIIYHPVYGAGILAGGGRLERR